MIGFERLTAFQPFMMCKVSHFAIELYVVGGFYSNVWLWQG